MLRLKIENQGLHVRIVEVFNPRGSSSPGVCLCSSKCLVFAVAFEDKWLRVFDGEKVAPLPRERCGPRVGVTPGAWSPFKGSQMQVVEPRGVETCLDKGAANRLDPNAATYG